MHDLTMHDAIIIGKGPAGLQAAIYLARTRLDTLVVGHGDGSLAKAAKVVNYFGFAEPIDGLSLLRDGEAQARALGARIVKGQAVGVTYVEGGFCIQLPGESFAARAVLIATGACRERPPVKGIDEYEGKGVSFCAVCDAAFYKGRKVGVLGYADYALQEAMELAEAGAEATIFTNGKEMKASEGQKGLVERFRVEPGRIAELAGENGRLRGVLMEDGASYALDGLFVAYGVAGSADFAKKLGLEARKDGSIAVDGRQGTNVPGIFAAGDCTGIFMQVAVAAGQGALAARSIIEYCKARAAE